MTDIGIQKRESGIQNFFLFSLPQSEVFFSDFRILQYALCPMPPAQISIHDTGCSIFQIRNSSILIHIKKDRAKRFQPSSSVILCWLPQISYLNLRNVSSYLLSFDPSSFPTCLYPKCCALYSMPFTRIPQLVTRNSQSATRNPYHTSPKIFHQAAATRIKTLSKTGVATRPAFVRSEDLKYR